MRDELNWGMPLLRFHEEYPKVLFSNSKKWYGHPAIASTEFTVCHVILRVNRFKESYKQDLYNAISRARVLCRVHMIVIKDEAYSRSQTELEELLNLFGDAKIKDETDYVAKLLKLLELLRLKRKLHEMRVPDIKPTGLQAES